jgi:DNA-binding CsgD family transcriptional regulator
MCIDFNGLLGHSTFVTPEATPRGPMKPVWLWAASPVRYVKGDAMPRIRPKSLAHSAMQSVLTTDEAPSTRELFSETEWRDLQAALALTSRQCEIAHLMCRGLSYKGIADEAGISINTVRMHMRTLFMKLGTHDRVTTILHLITATRGAVSCAHEPVYER